MLRISESRADAPQTLCRFAYPVLHAPRPRVLLHFAGLLTNTTPFKTWVILRIAPRVIICRNPVSFCVATARIHPSPALVSGFPNSASRPARESLAPFAYGGLSRFQPHEVGPQYASERSRRKPILTGRPAGQPGWGRVIRYADWHACRIASCGTGLASARLVCWAAVRSRVLLTGCAVSWRRSCAVGRAAGNRVGRMSCKPAGQVACWPDGRDDDRPAGMVLDRQAVRSPGRAARTQVARSAVTFRGRPHYGPSRRPRSRPRIFPPCQLVSMSAIRLA